MNIQELHDLLGKHIAAGLGEYQIILSSDSEGNRYSTLSEVTEPSFMIQYDYEYEFFDGEYDDDFEDDERTEPIGALVLYP